MPRHVGDRPAVTRPGNRQYAFKASALQLRLEGPLGQAHNAFFRLPGLDTQTTLPPAEYTLLAALAQKAIEARADPDVAFLSVQELGDILRRQVRTKNPAKQHAPNANQMKRNAVRAAYRLRKRLNGLPVGESLRASGVIERSRHFAHLLIERNQHLGYRLSIAPEALQLDMTPQQAPDYAFSGVGLRLTVLGWFGEQGRARFEAPSFSDTAYLSAAEWAVLALLVSQAQLQPPRSPQAFLSSAVLADQLDHAGVGTENDPQNVIRTVNRLRHRLGRLELANALAAANQLDSPAEFPQLLVLRSRLHGGYRINLPPSALAIEIRTQEM